MIVRLAPIAAFLAAALLAVPALAHPPECPALTIPVPAAECDAPVWGAWDGAKIVSRGLSLRGISPDCSIPAMSPGWAMVRTHQQAYPNDVIQTLYQVTETPPQVYIDSAAQTGCELRGYAVGWRSPQEIAVGIETTGRAAQRACAGGIVAGALGPGRTDYQDICAYAAGVQARIAAGEVITDPGQRDPLNWCMLWQRDCADPAIGETRRLLGLALAARERAATCDPEQADPDAPDYCLPAPDLCGDGWTHDPCAAPAGAE